MIEFISTQFSDEFSTDAFTSGKPSLDRWLIEHAKTAQAKRIAQVFVWHNNGDAAVCAYFTLSAHEIVAEDLPRRLHRGMPDKIPSILLGKLALDRSLHGRGLGGQLLYDVFQRVLSVSRDLGARYLVVDALDDEAATFYEYYGFTRMIGDHSLRLVRKFGDLEADVDAWSD
ncbi:GNAT family N-acetyltransferase [Nocardioides sp. AN3]